MSGWRPLTQQHLQAEQQLQERLTAMQYQHTSSMTEVSVQISNFKQRDSIVNCGKNNAMASASKLLMSLENGANPLENLVGTKLQLMTLYLYF